MNRKEIDYKKAREFGGIELLAKQVVEGFITGLHRSPFNGFSVEFAEHRLYNKGESTKNIDWKLFARTEKLFVKRYEEETNLRCRMVIDTSSSMYYPEDADHNKIDFAVNATAALIYLMSKQRDAVGVSLFDETLHLHTPCKSSPRHHRFLFAELEKYINNYKKEEKRTTSVVKALHRIAEQTHRRSLVVIFSDMMDKVRLGGEEEVFSALQHLRHNKHEVVLFHTLDKKSEIDLDFENRPYNFVDMESGEEVKLNPVQMKEIYNQAITERQRELKIKCAQNRIDYIQADIGEGFDHVLTQYLIKRQKMM